MNTNARVSVDLTQRRAIGGISQFNRETWFGTYCEAGYGSTLVNVAGTNKTVDTWICDEGDMLPSRGTVDYDQYWNGSGYSLFTEDPTRPGYIKPVELTNYVGNPDHYVTANLLNPEHKAILSGAGQGHWPAFMCWPNALTHAVNTVSNDAAHGEAVTIAYQRIKNLAGLIPQWYEVCNESDIQSNFGWFPDPTAWDKLASFHNGVAAAMAIAWPQIKVAGPTDSWPYRDDADGQFNSWTNDNKKFIGLSGNILGAYSFHAYEFDFAATAGQSTIYDAQFGSRFIWSKGRLESFADLWENEHWIRWGTRKPLIMSEYGALDWPATNHFNYLKACNAMLVAMLDRPDLMDKMSVFILSCARWNPSYRLTFFTSDDAGASYYQTRFFDYLRFWQDLHGEYLLSTSDSYHLVTRALFTNQTAYVVLHNNYKSGFNVNVQPQLPAGAVILNREIKMLFQDSVDLGYSSYTSLAALDSVPVPAEATCLLRLTLSATNALPTVADDSYYGDQVLADIHGGVDESFRSL